MQQGDRQPVTRIAAGVRQHTAMQQHNGYDIEAREKSVAFDNRGLSPYIDLLLCFTVHS
jgi:hypothetical protein